MKRREFVCDKKLLWRANLYIKEPSDWNDLHPWVEGNEWNRDEAGNVVTGANAGKQVVNFPSTTWPGRWNSVTGIFQLSCEQSDKVSYDYWGHDSPHDVINKVGQQKSYLQHGYNNAGVFGWVDAITNIAQRWQRFTSPPVNGTDYLNYLLKNTISVEVNSCFSNELSDQQSVSNCYPYVPSFTYWYDNRYNGNHSGERKYSAGLDCVAFTHQSISYLGQPYTNASGIGVVGNSATISNNGGNIAFRARPGAHLNYVNLIASKPEGQNDPVPVDLHKVIPGDIIWYIYYIEGEGGANDLTGHIGIVSSVDYKEQMSYGDIHIIESVYGTKNGVHFGGVVNHRTLADIQSFESTLTNNFVYWRIGRLKQ